MIFVVVVVRRRRHRHRVQFCMYVWLSVWLLAWVCVRVNMYEWISRCFSSTSSSSAAAFFVRCCYKFLPFIVWFLFVICCLCSTPNHAIHSRQPLGRSLSRSCSHRFSIPKPFSSSFLRGILAADLKHCLIWSWNTIACDAHTHIQSNHYHSAASYTYTATDMNHFDADKLFMVLFLLYNIYVGTPLRM